MAGQQEEILELVHEVDGMERGRYKHFYAACEQKMKAIKGTF